MASNPLSTTPTSMDDLPPEMRWTLTHYLGGKDLAEMRFLSSDWNAIAKTTLLKRKRFNFNFETIDKLAQFNETLAKDTPTEDFAQGLFCFKLPALDTVAATVHLGTFVQILGHRVTSLSLNLFEEGVRYRQEWFSAPCKRDTVLGHVILLLQKVKGQVEDLELKYCAGLRPDVIGHDPFPRLRSLTVGNCYFRAAAQEEACILLLSRMVPAIQRFEFKAFRGSNDGDPLFLSKVLRNLVRVNPQVEVKLDMDLPFANHRGDPDSDLLNELMTMTVRIVELDLAVHLQGFDLEPLRLVLEWIGAQSDCLKKLTFKVETRIVATALGGHRLPRLMALEELHYVQKTVQSLLNYTAADYPSLRKVTTTTTANNFTVALPQVTDLTVYRTEFTDSVPMAQGIYGADAFRLPPFPNLETLTCSVKFIDLGSIVQLQGLRRLTLTRDEESKKVHSFWKRVTNGARKLTLEEIRALPEPSEDEIRQRAEPCFSDLTNLREFKMAVDQGELTLVNLDALLWLSKTKRLQRLQKLEFEDKYLSTTVAVPEVYLTELRKYHNSVLVSYAKQLQLTNRQVFQFN